MKKIIFTVAMMILMVGTAISQEKGFYLTVSGTLASTQFKYEMDNHKLSTPQLGYGGGVGLQWFFSRHWGLATGANLACYNTLGKYNNSFENTRDNLGQDYSFTLPSDGDPLHSGVSHELQLRLTDWKERQTTWFLEVPLMFMYQTKWGEKQRHGMYLGLGAKAQIPMFGQEYKVKYDSKLTMLNYHPQWDLTLGEPVQLPHHGLGTNDYLPYEKPYTSDNLNVKTSWAGTFEMGFLIGLSRRVDLTIGAYVDYGFNNIKDGNNSVYSKDGGEAPGYLIDPGNNNRIQNEAAYIGGNMDYSGLINSKVVDEVNLFAVGGKLGLRIKLGKLKEEEVKEEEPIVVIEEVPESKPKPEPEAPVVVAPIIPEDAGITEAECAILKEPIFFDLNKSVLRPESIAALDRKANILQKYPEINIRILGNTCDLGGDRINVPLGQRRAESARDYLAGRGVNLLRMSTLTQASSHPIVPNTNEENRSKNRRDDFEPTSGCK